MLAIPICSAIAKMLIESDFDISDHKREDRRNDNHDRNDASTGLLSRTKSSIKFMDGCICRNEFNG